mmetsp:Transcript_48201/g.154488  ORF Transcript_48201/g.154488 Transcript_48201/m.154488 type:complete len:207 (+) Transcript_48201:3-623(+)
MCGDCACSSLSGRGPDLARRYGLRVAKSGFRSQEVPRGSGPHRRGEDVLLVRTRLRPPGTGGLAQRAAAAAARREAAHRHRAAPHDGPVDGARGEGGRPGSGAPGAEPRPGARRTHRGAPGADRGDGEARGEDRGPTRNHEALAAMQGVGKPNPGLRARGLGLRAPEGQQRHVAAGGAVAEGLPAKEGAVAGRNLGQDRGVGDPER